MPEGVRFISCSPRQDGNCEAICRTMGEELMRQRQGSSFRRLGERAILPCIACGFCTRQPGRCALPEPVLGPLFNDLFTHPVTCMVIPVYFYHVPAQTKAFIDRAQAYWAVPPAEKPGRGNYLSPVLLGGRKQGEKLFEGSLLTLRYFAETLGLSLCEPLLLYGLDERDAFTRDSEAQASVRAHAAALGALVAPPSGQ